MHPETKECFKLAILTSLHHVRPLLVTHTMAFQVWRKLSETQWTIQTEERSNVAKAIEASAVEIDRASEPLSISFQRHHSDHAGLVGFHGRQSNLGKNPAHLVRSALSCVWLRHKSLDVGDDEIGAIVQEFSDFVDSPKVRIKFQTQLLNFKMSSSVLQFPEGLSIRRLNEDEVSEIHGGPIGTIGMLRPRISGVHEFVIEGEFYEPKILGEDQSTGETMFDRAKAVLDKAITCLRTFKEGQVGFDYVQFLPVTFCPVGIGASGCGDLYVPIGTYALAEGEVQPLAEHATQVFGVVEKALELACSRLADAEHRTRPRDRIIDAVIGMEAVLLADNEKSELSFRFSLNYAMLFPPDGREVAFKTARNLYDLRSTLAHGSAINESKLKIAGEETDLAGAARIATQALRKIIFRFLKMPEAFYKDADYWRRAYFGLAEPRRCDDRQ